MQFILLATTAAAASEPFIVRSHETCVVSAPFLATTETATIQITNGDGTYRDIAESTAVLSATNKERTITGAATYRVNKGVTAAACPILLGQ